ncbi:MAG: hypothetical protein Q8R55_07970 [Candidatus Taylorbacteria bacterium]|nr:hypothetical protein [Candidatus Taylorbacteria bacterium]
MTKTRFSKFLITALALTAFLGGYLFTRDDFGHSKSRTGTILDKFSYTQQPTTDAQQPTDETKPLLITDRNVVSVTSSLNKGSLLYFEKNTGKLYEYDLNAKTEKVISDKILSNFISAIWSPTKKEALDVFTSNTGLLFKYLDTTADKIVDLDPNIRSAAFSPDGNLIVYHRLDDTDAQNEGDITISQPDGQYQKKILATRLNNPIMSWPNTDSLAFKTLSQEIFLLTEDGKLTKFLDIRLGLEEKWSPGGSKLLFSALSDDQDEPSIKLWIKDLASKEEKELIQASASKCVWSIDSINIYCAISKSPSVDEIYLINTDNGSSKLVAEPNIAIREMFLSTVEEHLLFTNTADEKLYSIKISD